MKTRQPLSPKEVELPVRLLCDHWSLENPGKGPYPHLVGIGGSPWRKRHPVRDLKA